MIDDRNHPFFFTPRRGIGRQCVLANDSCFPGLSPALSEEKMNLMNSKPRVRAIAALLLCNSSLFSVHDASSAEQASSAHQATDPYPVHREKLPLVIQSSRGISI